MIDYIQFEGEYLKIDMDAFLDKHPNIKAIQPNESQRLYFWWHNMRVDYFIPSQKLRISNSIHKLWNIAVNPISVGNHNYNDFNVSDVKATIEFICREFRIEASDFEIIGRLEYGLNMNIHPLDPYRDMISYYVSQQSKHPKIYGTFLNRENKVIGASANFGQYRVKFYDKSTQSKLTTNGIVRYEIVNLKNRRCKDLLGKKCVTLEDLTKSSNYLIFKEDLIRQYDGILKLPHLSDNPTKAMILNVLEYAHPLLKVVNAKSMNEWAFKKFTQNGNRLMKSYEREEGSFHNGMRNRMISKIDDLLNIPPCNSTIGLDEMQNESLEKLTKNI